MPIAAEFLDPYGRVVRGLDDPAGGMFDVAGDFDEVLPLVSPQRGVVSYRIMGSVDPYGTLDVGRDQMDDLLQDIAAMATLTSSPTARRGLDRLRAMAERCKQAEGTRIRFIGD